jgi:hypothetical protein
MSDIFKFLAKVAPKSDTFSMTDHRVRRTAPICYKLSCNRPLKTAITNIIHLDKTFPTVSDPAK